MAALRDAKIKVAQLRATFEALLDAVPSLANVVLVVVGAYRVQAGAITVGDVTASSTCSPCSSGRCGSSASCSPTCPRSLAGWDRVQGVLDRRRIEPEPKDFIGRPATGLGIALATCTSPTSRAARCSTGVDLSVATGRTVAVVGPTGAGKTTLLRGDRRAHGAEPRLGGGRAGGSRAMVFQESFLFAESIRENVLLGLDVPERRLRAALELSQAAGFVDELPDGVDTVVGRAGHHAVGRPAPAHRPGPGPRAPAPLLLLDDATSSLDPTTEALILTGLGRELDGRHHGGRGQPAVHHRAGRRGRVPRRRPGRGPRPPRRPAGHACPPTATWSRPTSATGARHELRARPSPAVGRGDDWGALETLRRGWRASPELRQRRGRHARCSPSSAPAGGSSCRSSSSSRSTRAYVDGEVQIGRHRPPRRHRRRRHPRSRTVANRAAVARLATPQRGGALRPARRGPSPTSTGCRSPTTPRSGAAPSWPGSPPTSRR